MIFFGPETPCDKLDGSVVALPYFAVYTEQSSFAKDWMQRAGLRAGSAMIIEQMNLYGDVDDMIDLQHMDYLAVPWKSGCL